MTDKFVTFVTFFVPLVKISPRFKELVDNLKYKDKNIQSNCIKVLYEIGNRGFADMIAPYCNNCGENLKQKNN